MPHRSDLHQSDASAVDGFRIVPALRIGDRFQKLRGESIRFAVLPGRFFDLVRDVRVVVVVQLLHLCRVGDLGQLDLVQFPASSLCFGLSFVGSLRFDLLTDPVRLDGSLLCLLSLNVRSEKHGDGADYHDDGDELLAACSLFHALLLFLANSMQAFVKRSL